MEQVGAEIQVMLLDEGQMVAMDKQEIWGTTCQNKRLQYRKI